MRLHCAVYNCHIGCTPAAAAFTMAFHKFLYVLICKECETFHGLGILHVVMMAVGHSAVGVARVATCTTVVFVQMYVFCKKCIRHSLDRNAMKDIAVKNNWVCYQRNMQPLWEHRALSALGPAVHKLAYSVQEEGFQLVAQTFMQRFPHFFVRR